MDTNCMASSRRLFLKQLAATTAAFRGSPVLLTKAAPATGQVARESSVPWYRRVLRWGQTNITELDPTRYDIPWWQGYWKRTQVQGIIVNAGGIVAYYPSRFPLHRRAQSLGDRDLFGDLLQAARRQGLAVLARMDSSRAGEEFYHAHPEWFAVDASGKPHRSGELYTSCINGPYFREYIPEVLREIAERYHPDGFTDNSWSGLGRNAFCYCDNCARKFRDQTGQELPARTNWDDPVYRQWLHWSYQCRLEIWDLNNRITRQAGGPDCLWVGMNSGSVTGQSQSLRDYKAICERAELILLDHQARADTTGFQNNGETGKLVHGLLGWDKLIPESMALYQAGRPGFRLTAKPPAEARLWMLDGFAGGLQPWWHHVGAFQEDRRAFRTVEPINRWHQAHEEFLVNRQPQASVGVVWSQQNTDFYGRDDADLLVEQPWRGITQALIRGRVPYLPVHAERLERDMAGFSALILPNLVAMSGTQITAVRQFVRQGGGLLATGDSSLANEFGDPRPDFALADLFGAHVAEKRVGLHDSARRRWAADSQHTYLRITAPGPSRPAVLQGFEETDLLPFGGTLEPLRVDSNLQVPLTFVPSFPAYPPESAFMRQPRTDIPGLILNERGARQGRVAFLSADIDRRFARDNLPDQGNLLASLVRWVAHDSIPLSVDGPGLIDCHLYRQSNRLILHLVNLTNAGTWRAPVDELIPVGPLYVQVKLPRGFRERHVRSLVAGGNKAASREGDWLGFELKSVLDHELVIIG
jgi:hypothetical protein